MTTYYRVSDGRRDIELTAEQYAEQVANGKAERLGLRLYIIDAQPAPTADQVVIDTGIVVGPVEAHQTYSLRAKTAAELEADAITAERAQAQAIIDDLVTQRTVERATWDAHTANQLRAEQWRDRQVLLRVAHFLMRRVRQEQL